MTESKVGGTTASRAPESSSGSSPRPAGPQPKQPPKQDRTTIALLFVAALVAVGGIGFALGHLTAPSAVAAANPSGRGAFGRNFASLAPGQTPNASTFGGRGVGGAGLGGGLGAVAGGITGTVQSITGTTITIQEASGTSVTIDLSGNTTYHAAAAASPSDVKIGSSVTVQIDTSALASQTPNPSASGALGGRTLSAKDILITQP
jgi:preprotein translocase subunit YajC